MFYGDFLTTDDSGEGNSPFPKTEPSGWYYFKEIFSDIDVSRVKKYVDENLELSKGSLAEYQEVNGGVDNSIRTSQVAWIPYNNETDWVWRKIGPMINEANKQMWNFDLIGCVENIQYSKYFGSEDNPNFYHWHMDCSPSMNIRKISCIIQLSDGDSYEGGNVELWDKSQHASVFPRDKGSTFFFPSYMMHRVRPVTSGIRESLVLWVSGPPYR